MLKFFASLGHSYFIACLVMGLLEVMNTQNANVELEKVFGFSIILVPFILVGSLLGTGLLFLLKRYNNWIIEFLLIAVLGAAYILIPFTVISGKGI